MNWKRGLARVYIVLWALFAITGGVFAVIGTTDALDKQEELNEFLASHKGRISLADMRTLPGDTLQLRAAERVVSKDGKLVTFPHDTPETSIRTALSIPDSDTIKFVRSFDYNEARAYNYTDAEIARYTARQINEGFDVRFLTDIPYGLTSALRDAGLSSEQIDRLSVGTVSSLHISILKDTAGSGLPRKLFEAWGLWFVACVALPAILFLTLYWIVRGFSK